MNGSSRRDFLAAIAAACGAGVAGFGYLSHTQEDEVILGGGGGEDNPRFEALSPISGGTAVAGGEVEGYGTLAGGVERDGSELVVTNRHVVDADYPDSDDDEVVGNEFRQPWNSEPVGEVVDVGRSKGTQATDWALVELDDSDLWTPRTIALPDVAGTTEVDPGDRIVMSGARTGLIGGEVTDVGVSRNWLGTILNGVIEYRVDENVDTAGNSGSWVAKINDTGGLEVVGIHTFADGDYRYAIPIDDLPGDVEFPSEGEIPTPDDSPAFVEGAIEDVDDVATVVVANVGGTAVDGRTVELRNDSGEVVASDSLQLDPLGETVLQLETDAELPLVLDTGDVERSTNWDF